MTLACNVYGPDLLADARPPGPSEGGAVNSTGGRSPSSGGNPSGGATETGGTGPIGTGGGGAITSGGSGGKLGTGGSHTGGSHTGGKSMGGNPNTNAGAGGDEMGGAAGESGSGSFTGGSGGTTGGTGTGGSAQTGGKASGGAQATGGVTGTGGTNGCTGCARLSIPLSASGDRAHFALSPGTINDFTNASLSFRIARLQGTGGSILLYFQEGAPDYHWKFCAAIRVDTLTTAMQNITCVAKDATGDANLTKIGRIGIEVNASGGSSLANPTVLYVDRMDVTGTSLSPSAWTFDTSDSISTAPSASAPSGKFWFNNYSADSTVTGAAISWVGP